MGSYRDACNSGRFVVSGEIGPPKGTNVENMLHHIDLLKDKVDGLNVTDNQSAVMRLGSLKSDLERLFRSWDGKSTEWRLAREQVAADAAGAREGQECSLHLARLWAAGEVARLTRARKVDDAMKAAVSFALERCKILLEPAGAAGIALLLDKKVETRPNGRVVVVASGGNFDLQRLKQML